MSMETPNQAHDQSHPLYSSDRDHVDRLLAKPIPEDGDLVDLARLLIRYEGFQGAHDLKADIDKTMRLWGMSKESLNEKTRNIWKEGYRSGSKSSDSVGSGFDTSDEGNLA